jgi:hypothetical protein
MQWVRWSPWSSERLGFQWGNSRQRIQDQACGLMLQSGPHKNLLSNRLRKDTSKYHLAQWQKISKHTGPTLLAICREVSLGWTATTRPQYLHFWPFVAWGEHENKLTNTGSSDTSLIGRWLCHSLSCWGKLLFPTFSTLDNPERRPESFIRILDVSLQ